MKLKIGKSIPIVGGSQMGHPHLNSKNHASKGIVASMPMGGLNESSIESRKFNAKKAGIQALRGGK